ncbi:hypothetical protein [Rhizobium sp. L1K21]|uniref:hypothetical protein n=1 Tax=Rhizobium sp. L1K21 TaxID=2954933 RepID=UPI0020932C64|nr:hypothetical protein [Rhizobium sp. L1K21]MCO6185666.1 hypothetical protein [Rhizobium sp. L1K21]
MFRLAAVLWVLVSTALAGAIVTALLSLNMFEGTKIAGGALIGAIVALPIAWLLGKKLYNTLNGRPV